MLFCVLDKGSSPPRTLGATIPSQLLPAVAGPLAVREQKASSPNTAEIVFQSSSFLLLFSLPRILKMQNQK